MGSTQHKKTQEEDNVFAMKEMIKKKTVVDPTQFYEFMDMLGEGKTSEVFKARSLVTGQFRVIKKVQKAWNPSLGRHLANEYGILKEMDHPNIIKMYEMFENNSHYFIITQFLGGSDVLELLRESKHFQEELAFSIFYQALLAIGYLHKAKVMHRDIKLENMIYDRSSGSLKLIDFGSALKFDQFSPRQRRCTGTIHYIAPEVLNKYYNVKCDIWSLGIALYVLLSGNAPFGGKDHPQIIEKIHKQPINFSSPVWGSRSKEVKGLISRMLQKNFEKRIGVGEILNDPWVVRHRTNRKLLQSEKKMVHSCLENMMRFKKIKISEIQLGVLIFMTNFIIRLDCEFVLQKAFHQIDRHHDGGIDEHELRDSLVHFMEFSTKKAEISAKELMHCIDFDNSGEISYSEFIIASSDLREVLSADNIARTFAFIDTDGSEKLSAEELKARLGDHLQESHYEKIIEQFDRDGDGEISRREFSRMMEQLLKHY